jgi:hypothetical protein
MPERHHDSTQADKFRDLARELECDEDEAKFEETVKRVAKVPTPKRERDDD